MALPDESALSRACHKISQYLELYVGSDKVDVLLGDPKSAENYLKSQSSESARDVLNIFIYKIDSHEFDADVQPDGLWRIRAYGLITPFSLTNRTDVENPPASGEVDLRLLGQVLAAFHEKPIMDELALDDISGRLKENEKTIRVQAVFLPLTAEEINHIWSTVGEISYRPSVAYEFALIPVIPKSPLVEGPVVTDIELDVHTISEGQENALWVPEIRMVYKNECHENLRFRKSDPDLGTFQPKIMISGIDLNRKVDLIVSQWERGQAWKIINQQEVNVNTLELRCNPASETGAAVITLSAVDKNKLGQISIVAKRSYKRPQDNKIIKFHSNLLIINIEA